MTAFDTFTGEHELTFKYPTPRKNPILFPSPSDDDEDEEKVEEKLDAALFLTSVDSEILAIHLGALYLGVPEPPLEDGGMVFALPSHSGRCRWHARHLVTARTPRRGTRSLRRASPRFR